MVHPKCCNRGAYFHILKNGWVLLHLHTTTEDQKTLILCSKVLAHKHSHVLFVKDIKTSVYPALSAGKQRNGCEATSYVRPHTTMDNSLQGKHEAEIHYMHEYMHEWSRMKNVERWQQTKRKCLGRRRGRRIKIHMVSGIKPHEWTNVLVNNLSKLNRQRRSHVIEQSSAVSVSENHVLSTW